MSSISSNVTRNPFVTDINSRNTTSSTGSGNPQPRSSQTSQAEESNQTLQQLVEQLTRLMSGNQDTNGTRNRNNRESSNTPQFQENAMLTMVMALLAMILQMMTQASRGAGNVIIMIFNFLGNSPENTEGGTSRDLAKQLSKDPAGLDTDGNNQLDLTSVEEGVQFDMDGDGQKEQVAWTEAKGEDTDAWLTLDRNGNGEIDNGKELFGDQHGAANGFDELKKFDGNGDGKIDQTDDVYKDLRTWQDKNHDGISQDDEMKSLEEAGVKSINLNYENSNEVDRFGNQLREQGTFERTDERARDIATRRGISQDEARTGKAIDAWLGIGR